MLQQLGRSDRFVHEAPSAQTAIDASPVPWASHIPLNVSSGDSRLFEDTRVTWALEHMGGVASADCLELGPLEGGHTYMLEHAGATRVVAVEANRDAYLKCLITKEVMELRRSTFLCGDVIEYLRTNAASVDVCWCAGILYHMVEPLELIRLISERASRLFIWTHYYDGALQPRSERKGKPFKKGIVSQAHCDGYATELHRHEYGIDTRLGRFWGGTQPYSNWMTLDGLRGALSHFGWEIVATDFEEDHPHGPAVNLVARKPQAGEAISPQA